MQQVLRAGKQAGKAEQKKESDTEIENRFKE